MRKMVVCLSGMLWGLFSGAWMFVSNRASWERAIQHTKFYGRRTRREVVVRLQRHDSILDPHPRYYPIVLDDDTCFGRHTNAGGTNCGWGNSIGNDTHSATRVRRADRARVCVLPLWGRQGRVVEVSADVSVSCALEAVGVDRSICIGS